MIGQAVPHQLGGEAACLSVHVVLAPLFIFLLVYVMLDFFSENFDYVELLPNLHDIMLRL